MWITEYEHDAGWFWRYLLFVFKGDDIQCMKIGEGVEHHSFLSATLSRALVLVQGQIDHVEVHASQLALFTTGTMTCHHCRESLTLAPPLPFWSGLYLVFFGSQRRYGWCSYELACPNPAPISAKTRQLRRDS